MCVSLSLKQLPLKILWVDTVKVGQAAPPSHLGKKFALAVASPQGSSTLIFGFSVVLSVFCQHLGITI